MTTLADTSLPFKSLQGIFRVVEIEEVIRDGETITVYPKEPHVEPFEFEIDSPLGDYLEKDGAILVTHSNQTIAFSKEQYTSFHHRVV